MTKLTVDSRYDNMEAIPPLPILRRVVLAESRRISLAAVIRSGCRIGAALSGNEQRVTLDIDDETVALGLRVAVGGALCRLIPWHVGGVECGDV